MRLVAIIVLALACALPVQAEELARVYYKPLAVATPVPTPTPRPTTIVFSSTNSTVCGVNDRYFGAPATCNATYTSVDWTPVENGTFTTMTCSQPTDAVCSITFTLYLNSGSPGTGWSCLSVDTAACSPSSPTPTTFTAGGNLVAIRVDDTGGNCGSNAPTCVVEYTVP